MTITPPPAPKRILGLPVAGFVAVLVGAVALCCVGAIIACVNLPAITDAVETDPTVTITACTIGEKDATVRFTIKNNGFTTSDYSVKFEILDTAGKRVADVTERVISVAAGSTEQDHTTAFFNPNSGAKSCELVSVSQD